MAHKVFFSFDFQRDLWRANVVRNIGSIEATSAGGFSEPALGDRAKGDDEIKKSIDEALKTTDVTVVLIGAETANRKYVSYEIEKAIECGNAILGIRINNLKDKDGNVDALGAVPDALTEVGAPVYTYEYGKIGEWVEEAIKRTKSA